MSKLFWTLANLLSVSFFYLILKGQGLDGQNKKFILHFPGGTVVKNLPANTGDMGSIPGPETKIPHAVRQLSPCATTTEPTHPRVRAPPQEKPLQWEAWASQPEKAGMQ